LTKIFNIELFKFSHENVSIETLHVIVFEINYLKILNLEDWIKYSGFYWILKFLLFLSIFH